MGALSRTKGHAFEREVAKELQPLYPSARRGLSQPRNGREVPDVEGTPWWIECKRGNSATLPQAVKQAKEATDGRLPIVFVRRDRERSLVVMDVDDFKRLLADVEELREIRAVSSPPMRAAAPSVPIHELTGNQPEYLEGT